MNKFHRTKFLAVNFLGFRSLSSHSSNLNKNEAELFKDEFTLENFYDWFRGFTDAEGCFSITHLRDKFWRFSFEIKLHIDDANMLYFIQNTLGIGKVYISGTTCRFMVSKQSEVQKIIEIFTKYPLNSSKRLNFFTLLVNSEAKLLNYTPKKGIIQPSQLLIRSRHLKQRWILREPIELPEARHPYN